MKNKLLLSYTNNPSHAISWFITLVSNLCSTEGGLRKWVDNTNTNCFYYFCNHYFTLWLLWNVVLLRVLCSYTECHLSASIWKKHWFAFQHKHLQLVFCFAILHDKCTHKKHKHTFFFTYFLCFDFRVLLHYYFFHNKEVTDCTINNIHFTLFHYVNNTYNHINTV